MGREWIEISYINDISTEYWSPSLGREWIEIEKVLRRFLFAPSPSLGREWIEISDLRTCTSLKLVSLLGEGVD